MAFICLIFPSKFGVVSHIQARHQKAILDMNNELETEISTIQNNLRQRAVELEKQVNSRVKRIENAEKRKKKK